MGLEHDALADPPSSVEVVRRIIRALRVRPPRRSSPRALSVAERTAVLAVRHAPRFVDLAPAEVYAALLGEGQDPRSGRTMYRLPVGGPR